MDRYLGACRSIHLGNVHPHAELVLQRSQRLAALADNFPPCTRGNVKLTLLELPAANTAMGTGPGTFVPTTRAADDAMGT
eukprot:CAMPEP_0117542164 /NCGR_PEP_ID=MMETSP0784-20121206/44397_1 /TAXON_ID=39447 /ORGANISM="" /LENGTH=79 /DNA_ID=CAMNT_0005338889 /DNA_START=217 /DNA_END=452 /DNA_ORIENTATION=+